MIRIISKRIIKMNRTRRRIRMMSRRRRRIRMMNRRRRRIRMMSRSRRSMQCNTTPVTDIMSLYETTSKAASSYSS